MPRPALPAICLAALALTGCSLTQKSGSGPSAPPAAGAKSTDKNAASQLGFPTIATKDTTRVSGSDPVADAAGVASAVSPATTPAGHPPVVALGDQGDWQAGIAAASLAAPPVHAAILLSDGGSLPAITSQTLDRLAPTGNGLPDRTQLLRVGDKPPAAGTLASTVVHGADPYALAAAIDHFATVAAGKPSANVVIASGEDAAYAMPAAGWAARSGDAVLFTRHDSLPAPTRAALAQHQKPHIYLLGPQAAIGSAVERQLRGLGQVKRIQGSDPVQNAIAFSRFKDGTFGFGAVVPGQNFTLVNSARPLDAAAAAALGGNGIFASILLTDQADALPKALESYFLDVQPGFERGDPSQGVFNHVWILGAATAIGAGVQAQVDSDTQLLPVDRSMPQSAR
ncbi:MAG: hypothetical protein NVS2B6_01720 [Thermoleophilaceae bacterium]